MHLTPYTLHLTPYTLHLTPYTLHLTPYTLHLTPYLGEAGRAHGVEAAEEAGGVARPPAGGAGGLQAPGGEGSGHEGQHTRHLRHPAGHNTHWDFLQAGQTKLCWPLPLLQTVHCPSLINLCDVSHLCRPKYFLFPSRNIQYLRNILPVTVRLKKCNPEERQNLMNILTAEFYTF